MLKNKLIAIHQPNFFPWLGYFHKIYHSDCFIVLDDAQFSRKGGTWTNRVRILRDEPRWFTLPVDRSYHGYRAVNEMRFAPQEAWREKLKDMLAAAYRKTPFFDALFIQVSSMLDFETELLWEYNMHILKSVLNVLRISSDHMHLASDFCVQTHGTQRLIDLTRAVGGTAYLCGGGAQGYQEDALFSEQGVALLEQNFVSPQYPQVGQEAFVPGLSILDALFNIGPEATARLITEHNLVNREPA